MAFKKSINIAGKYKALNVTEEGTFVDVETGEALDLAEQLYQIYGENPFSLSTSYKDDIELD